MLAEGARRRQVGHLVLHLTELRNFDYSVQNIDRVGIDFMSDVE